MSSHAKMFIIEANWNEVVSITVAHHEFGLTYIDVQGGSLSGFTFYRQVVEGFLIFL